MSKNLSVPEPLSLTGLMTLVNLLRRAYASLFSRREYRRAPTNVSVDWYVFGSAVHRVSTTADISPCGASIATVEPAAVGSPVVLALKTVQGPRRVHARVAWAGRSGMGVRFTLPHLDLELQSA